MHRSPLNKFLGVLSLPGQTNWDVLLPMCEFALNSTKSASTGYTPAYVLFGREPVLPLEHAVR